MPGRQLRQLRASELMRDSWQLNGEGGEQRQRGSTVMGESVVC